MVSSGRRILVVVAVVVLVGQLIAWKAFGTADLSVQKIAATTSPPPTRTPTATSEELLTFDLTVIDDARNVVADAIEQIHHGIYRVVVPLSATKQLQLALKTECRPAAKWHGQQGWSEIAAFALLHRIESATVRNSMPPARGVIVFVPTTVADKVVHRDRCGVLTKSDLAAHAKGSEWREGYTPLIGVALQWRPRHNDNALPAIDFVQWFHTQGNKPLPNKVLDTVLQVSDVQVFDYLIGNEDREEKNWFHDDEGRFVMMDNGWAFAGRNYVDSICSAYDELLVCPPLLRRLSRSPKCAGVENCRFRSATIERIRAFRQLWSNLSDEWMKQLVGDPLIQYLLSAHNTETTVKKKIFNNALARYVDKCELLLSKPADRSQALLGSLRDGIALRLDRLVRHVDSCVSLHGKPYVFGPPTSTLLFREDHHLE